MFSLLHKAWTKPSFFLFIFWLQTSRLSWIMSSRKQNPPNMQRLPRGHWTIAEHVLPPTPRPQPLLSFYSLLDAPNAFLCFMVWVVHRKTSYQSHPALCCKKRWKGTQREPDSGALFSACSHGGDRRYQKCNRSWFHIRTACVTDMLSKLWRLCCWTDHTRDGMRRETSWNVRR